MSTELKIKGDEGEDSILDTKTKTTDACGKACSTVWKGLQYNDSGARVKYMGNHVVLKHHLTGVSIKNCVSITKGHCLTIAPATLRVIQFTFII